MYYDKIRHRHSQVLAATGLTPVEFEALLITFKHHWASSTIGMSITVILPWKEKFVSVYPIIERPACCL